jgi:WD40 repeat protein
MVRVFSTSDGKIVHELKGHASHVQSVAFDGDNHLASGDLRGVVKHWDLRNGRCLRDLDASKLFKQFHQYEQGGVRRMTFDTDFRTLYCAGFEGTNANQAQGVPTVVSFDWTAGKAQMTMTPRNTFNGPIMDVVYHPAGYLIGAGSSEAGGVLWFWRSGQEKDEHELKFVNSFRGMDLHRDGRRLTVAAFGNRDGQRGGNGRKLVNGEYVDFEGSIVFYTLA